MRLVYPLAMLFITGCSPALNNERWAASCESLEGGRFQACYGPFIKPNDRYESLHDSSKNTYLYYWVSVEMPINETSRYTKFEKHLMLDEVTPDLLTERPVKVVSFDPASRLVTFDLGKTKLHHSLNSM